MTRPFERLAIVGLGLLGGSVALAARRAGVARWIVAAGRRPAPLEQALADGVVDEVADLAGAIRGADLVVLATPVGLMGRLVEDAAPYFAAGALVTDVGSVKETLAETLPGVLPPGVHYVGAHPMAGSHERGVGHARADLFDGACCVVTPFADTDPEALERVSGFWRALGARVTLRDPALHDAHVAWVSHVPHVLAFAFAHALGRAPEGAGEMAGSGLRDFTRIAHSDAELWSEILSINRKALVGPLQTFSRSLEELAAVIDEGDTDAQESFLAIAHQALAEVAPGRRESAPVSERENARSGGDNPEIQAGPEEAGHPRSSKNIHD